MRKSMIMLVGIVLAMTAVAAQAATLSVVAQYELGENDPGAVAGAAGNAVTKAVVGPDAVLQGAGPTYSSNTPGTASTLSMLFTGTNGYKGTLSSAMPTTNWGMEAWVNLGQDSGYQCALNVGPYFMGYFPGGLAWVVTGKTVFAQAAVATNTWHNVALVMNDSSVLTAYLDGVALNTTTATNPGVDATAIGIGYDGAFNRDKWVGGVDHVRIFTYTGTFDASTDLSLNMNKVPEPSTIALLVVGALGLIAYAWRKRK